MDAAAADEASRGLPTVDFDQPPHADTAPALSTAPDPAPGDRAGENGGSTDGESDFDQVLRSSQAGVDSAFVQIYRALHPGLLRYLHAFVGDQADDVASDTWAQVCRDLARFTGDFNGFRGWVTRIGRNRAIDHLRAQGRRPAISIPPEDLHHIIGTADTARDASDAISTQAAIRMIRSLPQDQAEAVLIRVVMGVDAKTAGAVLGKRAGAVRTLTYRGLKTLAARLDETL